MILFGVRFYPFTLMLPAQSLTYARAFPGNSPSLLLLKCLMPLFGQGNGSTFFRTLCTSSPLEILLWYLKTWLNIPHLFHIETPIVASHRHPHTMPVPLSVYMASWFNIESKSNKTRKKTLRINKTNQLVSDWLGTGSDRNYSRIGPKFLAWVTGQDNQTK